MKNRLQSPIVWTAIVAQALAILLALGVIDIGQSETIDNLIVTSLQLLVVLGVLHNPTKKDGC